MDETDPVPEKKYSWSFKDGKMNCCESTTSTCNVAKLWGVTGLTTLHDSELQQATLEINAILDRARKTNRDKKRELHFVQVEDRHMLAWVHSDLSGPLAKPRAIDKMLKLKRSRAPAGETP